MIANPATVQFLIFAVKEAITIYPSIKKVVQAILDEREVTLEMWATALADVERLKINLPLPARQPEAAVQLTQEQRDMLARSGIVVPSTILPTQS